MKLEIDGTHNLGNRDIVKYINKKIGGLDKYIPKHAKKSVHAEVKLREQKVKEKKECTAEVVLHLPGENIAAKESTMNMFAAVDIVEEKIKIQLKRYKEKNKNSHYSPIKRILRRFHSSED
jgi:putative sigma-54 modulation protein